jgi:hypothetical protein
MFMKVHECEFVSCCHPDVADAVRTQVEMVDAVADAVTPVAEHPLSAARPVIGSRPGASVLLTLEGMALTLFAGTEATQVRMNTLSYIYIINYMFLLFLLFLGI